MSGIFDLKTGAFDSSEAAVLHQAYEIALHGLRETHTIDRPLRHRLARSIVKVARGEADCLRNDGTLDPIRLAQRAILRMLQTSAPRLEAMVPDKPGFRDLFSRRAAPAPTTPETPPVPPPKSAATIMLRLFERTPFAKL